MKQLLTGILLLTSISSFSWDAFVLPEGEHNGVTKKGKACSLEITSSSDSYRCKYEMTFKVKGKAVYDSFCVYKKNGAIEHTNQNTGLYFMELDEGRFNNNYSDHLSMIFNEEGLIQTIELETEKRGFFGASAIEKTCLLDTPFDYDVVAVD